MPQTTYYYFIYLLQLAKSHAQAHMIPAVLAKIGKLTIWLASFLEASLFSIRRTTTTTKVTVLLQVNVSPILVKT